MKNLRFASLALLALVSTLTFADPLGTVFTYQGELKLLGEPANGNFDFKFDLFDVETEGSEVATSVELADVPVADGIFSVELDYGAVPFGSKQQMWLQIAVREASSIDIHTVLTPRQKLATTLFAINSLLGHDHPLDTNHTRGGMNSLVSNTTGLANTAYGHSTLENNSTGSDNTAVGFWALRNNVTGSNHTAIGYMTLESISENIGDPSLVINATAVGSHALNQSQVGWNTAIGHFSLFANKTGLFNTAVGGSSLSTNTTGSNNTALGEKALERNTTGGKNTAIGDTALRTNSDGSKNIAIGYFAMESNVSSNNNTAVGNDALRGLISGDQNTAIGYGAMSNAISGENNVAIGGDALKKTSGANSTAVGEGALINVTTGDGNTALGNSAGSQYTDGSYNIAIANIGIAGESNTTRIGSSNQTRTFVSGIRGTSTGLSDAVTVVIDSNGQLGTISSSRRYKQDINDMEEESVGILGLRPVTFRYAHPYEDGSKPVQYGLIAEEVVNLFPALVALNDDGEPETVKYHLLSTLLLNEMKKQARQIDEQNEAIAVLQAEIRNLTKIMTLRSGEYSLAAQ